MLDRYSGDQDIGIDQGGMCLYHLPVRSIIIINTNQRKYKSNIKQLNCFLTTVSFIRAITTIIICVTEPNPWDTPVGTAELVSRACAWVLRSTVSFITAIKTVIVPITAPIPGHAALIGTGEGRGGAGIV